MDAMTSPVGPPPGWGPPPAWGPPPKPGIIPLRPLSLSEIFGGAVVYVRGSPGATLGLATIVVVAVHVITTAATLGALAAYGRPDTGHAAARHTRALGAAVAALGGSQLVSWLGGILLSGMLTVVVGRAVFGSTITIAETWARIRGRLLPLFGLALLEGAVVVALAGMVAVLFAVLAAIGSAPAAVVLGFPSVLATVAVAVYLYAMVSFAPVLVVLERLPVVDAITRSFALVRHDFWRVLGIRLLAVLVASVIATMVGAPSSLVGQIMAGGYPSSGLLLAGGAVASIGGAIGQIVTSPFAAGVTVLLYTDRRMRAEGFDRVLQAGATAGPYAAAYTDSLWLTKAV
jgi:hypothetical protein